MEMEQNKRSWLLAKLIEESADVIQHASKALLYGDITRDSAFGAIHEHRKKLQRELGDVLAIIGLLSENGIIDDLDDDINRSVAKFKNRKELAFLFE